MGLFDFLKTTVKDKRKPAVGRSPQNASCIEVDSRSYPLSSINGRGFVASQFDGVLVQGQNARISVKVKDDIATFSFTTTVTITGVKDGSLVGEWMMLPPELEQTIRKYNQRHKLKAGTR